ncbi:hypothetical protein T01_3953 [Trichinella spiralis]|uniref:Uncharacterized protein n=1 Tax=Trichinella spiralis TaxID=6334 RepID=A0A0V1BXV5_TRISP|nr:hypothetical protein T01_3953 [Trichinella spiralis]
MLVKESKRYDVSKSCHCFEQNLMFWCPIYLSCVLSSNRCGEMYLTYKGRAMKPKYVGKRLKWWGYSKAVLLKV